MKPIFIFYVADQKKSRDFYAALLDSAPALDVPGMTEFDLGGSASLGLMPVRGIRALLGEKLPDPGRGEGIPRAELYLRVEDAALFHRRALENGGTEIDPLNPRDWGDRAAYSLDPDGHVLAFAEPL